MSQSYIHENLVIIEPLIPKILCKQESDANADADTNAMVTHQNQYVPLLLGGNQGHNADLDIHLIWSYDTLVAY